MGETNGEKLYNAFDSLIDEADELGFCAVAEKLRRMRDRLPNKPTQLDEGVGLVHGGEPAVERFAKMSLHDLHEEKQKMRFYIRSCSAGVPERDWTELDDIYDEIKRRKALFFLDKYKATQDELARVFAKGGN